MLAICIFHLVIKAHRNYRIESRKENELSDESYIRSLVKDYVIEELRNMQDEEDADENEDEDELEEQKRDGKINDLSFSWCVLNQ